MFKAPNEGNYRSCRRDAPQEEQAFDIVDEVRQSHLRLRSRDSDGPDEQTHPILLLGEDMLDLGSDNRTRKIRSQEATIATKQSVKNSFPESVS
jgi:hypothetical protein